MTQVFHNGRMAGKKVLVTGSGTGIGREIALEFGREGADVAIHYVHEEDGAATAVGELTALGRRAAAFRADFTNIGQAQRLGQKAVDFLGGLDVLVNNAGITMNRPFAQVTPEQFDVLHGVNVRSPFFLTQVALPALVAGEGGAVINIASIHALSGYPQHSVYAGTKGAIIAWTRQLAIELAPKNVRVNAIAPGTVQVENYRVADPGFDPKHVGALIPCGFVGDPRDIARAVLFLASDDSRFIVGQTLVVDGGTTSWLPYSDAFRQPQTAQFGKGYVPGL